MTCSLTELLVLLRATISVTPLTAQNRPFWPFFWARGVQNECDSCEWGKQSTRGLGALWLPVGGQTKNIQLSFRGPQKSIVSDQTAIIIIIAISPLHHRHTFHQASSSSSGSSSPPCSVPSFFCAQSFARKQRWCSSQRCSLFSSHSPLSLPIFPLLTGQPEDQGRGNQRREEKLL